MNLWLLSSAALSGLIVAVHSIMGESRIFRPWARQPPSGVKRFHQQMLRGSWHLFSLLGAGQAATLVWLGSAQAADLPALGLQQAILSCLAAGVAACGILVLWLTQGRHHGGTAMLAAAVLTLIGLAQAGAR